MFGWLRHILGMKNPSAPPTTAGADRFDLTELARRLGVPAAELTAFEPRYASFTVPKRRGGRRTILAPDEATKRLHRRVLRRLLDRLSAHEAVHGFERGRSIVTNAAPHTGRQVVLRLDLKDFFPSTSADRVQAYFRTIGWTRDAAALLTRLCMHDGGLPQGAPTSPRLANLVNVPMDARLAAVARSIGATYTRYADDLTFSSDERVRSRGLLNPKTREPLIVRRWINELIPIVKRVVAEYGYALHEGPKLRIMRRGDRQQVTGLVVNDHPQLPRPIRRRLRAIEHHHRTGRTGSLTPEQLAGWRSLQRMIDAQSQESQDNGSAASGSPS